jgi:hypothetical protein
LAAYHKVENLANFANRPLRFAADAPYSVSSIKIQRLHFQNKQTIWHIKADGMAQFKAAVTLNFTKPAGASST